MNTSTFASVLKRHSQQVYNTSRHTWAHLERFDRIRDGRTINTTQGTQLFVAQFHHHSLCSSDVLIDWLSDRCTRFFLSTLFPAHPANVGAQDLIPDSFLFLLSQVQGITHELRTQGNCLPSRMGGPALWDRDFHAHQRGKLLPSMEVPISKITLDNRARDREFDCQRTIAGKEANRIHRAHIEIDKGILIKTPRRFDELVMFFVCKHDVKGQEERSGILTADQGREICEFHWHAPEWFLISSVSPSSTNFVRNISCGDRGRTTWLTLNW